VPVKTTTERVVSYWAVQGDRWCNVDGMISPGRVVQWEEWGWRIVTRVTEREMLVYGELQNEKPLDIPVEFEE
jgi:hypothetical protein